MLATQVNKQTNGSSTRRVGRKGFSLIELVIVVVIIAIIAAIAVPRMSRGSAGASDSAVAGDLQVLRSAVDLYATEHGGTYPGVVAGAAADVTKIANQLLTYTDDAGNAVATKDSTHPYGPYLRILPTLPVGARKGGSTIAAADAASVGWIYNTTTNTITANTTTEADTKGTLYNTY